MLERSRRRQLALMVACVVCSLFAAPTGGVRTFAGEVADVSGDVATVRPMIGETTALVVKIDTARLALPDLTEAFLKAAAPGSDEVYRGWTRMAGEKIEIFRDATCGRPVYATIGIPLSKNEWPVFVFMKSAPDVDQKALFERLGATEKEISSSARKGLVVATPVDGTDVAAALEAMAVSPRSGLDEAFRAVARYPIQALLLPPDYVRRTIVELMPELPRQLGGGPSSVLSEGVVWAAFGLDPVQLRAELVVQSASEEAARRLGEHLPRMLQSAYDALPEFQQQVPREAVRSLISLLAPKVQGDRVVLRMDKLDAAGGSLRLAAIVAAAIQQRTRRGTNADNFKRILLAVHNYHDAYKVFPPRNEVRDKQGSSGLSWRVHLLPFVDEQKLYVAFHLDEPWDSPHNRTLIERMPNVYQSDWFGRKPGYTTFLAPVGEDTVFGGPKATRIQDILDGTSNTVVLVEAKPELAVPWTAPQDYNFDPNVPGRGLDVGTDGRFLAGFADGSVQRLRGNIEPELLLRLFRKNDGRTVDWRAIR